MVTSDKFDASSWSDRLAQALVTLAEVHECFPNSLGEHEAHYRRFKRRRSHPKAPRRTESR